MSGKQEWRVVLRESLNWLRDELKREFESEAGRLLKEPWRVRDFWKDAMLRGKAVELYQQFAKDTLDENDLATLERVYLIQENALKMSSCGWPRSSRVRNKTALEVCKASIGLSQIDVEAEFVQNSKDGLFSERNLNGEEIWHSLYEYEQALRTEFER